MLRCYQSSRFVLQAHLKSELRFRPKIPSEAPARRGLRCLPIGSAASESAQSRPRDRGGGGPRSSHLSLRGHVASSLMAVQHLRMTFKQLLINIGVLAATTTWHEHSSISEAHQ